LALVVCVSQVKQVPGDFFCQPERSAVISEPSHLNFAIFGGDNIIVSRYVFLLFNQIVAYKLFQANCLLTWLGRAIDASLTRWNQSRILTTAMSHGVVVVASSLYNYYMERKGIAFYSS
jgi:hypothetical protein